MQDIRHCPLNAYGTFFSSKDFEIYEEMLPIHGLKNWTDGANIFASYIYQRISARYTKFSFLNNGHGSSYVR